MIRALVLLIVLLQPGLALADDITGHWRFYKKIFREEEMPEPPSASLRLHFEFFPDGTDHLYWWHEGDNDLCSRRGSYKIEDGKLVDTVIWVDPKNHRNCSSDPDMQDGKTTRTPISFKDQDLMLWFHLNGEPLIMVWHKESETSPQTGEM